MHIQKQDLTTTWNITGGNHDWTLARKARITVENQHGIVEDSFEGGNAINVLGDIVVKSGGYSGLRFNGPGSSVTIGEDSRVNASQAQYGIYSEASGADIVNRGEILASYAGIFGTESADVKNYGLIKAALGMVFIGAGSQIVNRGDIDCNDVGIVSEASNTLIRNARGAEISGADEGIYINGTGGAEIINDGVLRGGDSAIRSDQASLSVTNTGKIVGDVMLGDANDVFDSRKGVVKGVVEGGDGGDVYMIGKVRYEIAEGENVGLGADRVEASASYKLADNIEILELQGRKNINGIGNGDDNEIVGNRGDNRLAGGAGHDVLFGDRGNDILTGHVGDDVFSFDLKGGGIDRVTDFEDGDDLILIYGIDNQSDFDTLHIKQVGDDVVIALDKGDRVIIEGMLKSDFDFSDILV